LLPVVFGVWCFKLSVWCGAEGYVSGLRAATIMPIIRSSRVLYRWLLPVVFSALVFKLSVWCGAWGYGSGLRAAQPKHQIPQAATTCIILSSSWWCA
jgi:hypothetical protein